MSLIPTYKSLSALSPIYLRDPEDKINYINQNNFTQQGINLLTYNINKSANDSFIKNYTSNNLVKNLNSNDIYNFKRSILNQDLNSKLIFKSTSRELSSGFVAQALTRRDDRDSPITFNIDIVDLNGSKFLVDFLDKEFLTVSFLDGKVPKVLYDEGKEALIFKFLDSTEIPLTANYYFNYFYDDKNNKLRLFKDNKIVSTITTTLTTDVRQVSGQDTGEQVFVNVTLSSTINSIGLLETNQERLLNGTIQTDPKISLLNSNNIDQFIYYDFLNNNQLSNDTISDIKYDILSYYTYSNINSGDKNFADLNFFNLKNHISNDNIAYSGENLGENADNNLLYIGRKYQNFTNQKSNEKDFDNLSLNYTFFDSEFKIGSNELTEFTMPNNLFPFERLNINDTGLADNGSFASTSPYFSDKVYKLTDTNRNKLNRELFDIEQLLELQNPSSLLLLQNGKFLALSRENIKNDIFGTYLCTWLKGNGEDRGIWYDRYYLPKDNSYTVSFTGVSNQFDSSTQAKQYFENNHNDSVYYDLISNLTFEPSASYIYQRVNDTQVNNYIDNQKDKLIRDTFTVQTSTVQLQQIKEVNLNTVKGYDNIDIKNIPNNNFNLGFELELDSLSSLDSYQLFGNLYEDGFSIKNNFYFTPFIFIPQGNVLHIYDNNFKLLRTNTYDSVTNIIDILYIEQNNNIILVCGNKLIKTNYFGEILDERVDDSSRPDNSLLLEIFRSYKSRTFYDYNNVLFITNRYDVDTNVINLDLNNLVLSDKVGLNLQFESLSSNPESIVPTQSGFRFLRGRNPIKLNETNACSLEEVDRFISKQFIPGEAFLGTSLGAQLSTGIVQNQSFDENYYTLIQTAPGESAVNNTFLDFFNFVQDGRARVVFDNINLTDREDPILDSITSQIFDINGVDERLFVQYVNLTGSKGFVQEFTTERFKLSAYELSRPTKEGYKVDFIKEDKQLKILSFAKDLSGGLIFVDKINAGTGKIENSYQLNLSGVNTNKQSIKYCIEAFAPGYFSSKASLSAIYPNGIQKGARLTESELDNILSYYGGLNQIAINAKFTTLSANKSFINPINYYALDQKYSKYGEKIVFKFNLNAFLNVNIKTEQWDKAGPPLSANGYSTFHWTNPAFQLSAWDGTAIVESSEPIPNVEVIFEVPNIRIKNYFNIDFNLNGGEIKLYNNGVYFGTITFNPNLIPIERIIYPELFINTQNIRNIPIDNIVKDISYNSKGGIIKNFKLHSKCFDNGLVNYLELQTKPIDPLYFRMPCGSRNSSEEIDTLFTYNIPGNISNNIKVNIKDIDIDNKVKNQLIEYLEKSVEIITPSQQTLTYNID